MSKNEKKLQFVEDAMYDGKLAHKKGEVKTLDNSLGMADRWIKRGVAIVIVEETKEEKAAKEKAEAEAKAKAEAEEKAKVEAEAKLKADAEKAAQKPATVANAKAPVNNKENDL